MQALARMKIYFPCFHHCFLVMYYCPPCNMTCREYTYRFWSADVTSRRCLAEAIQYYFYTVTVLKNRLSISYATLVAVAVSSALLCSIFLSRSLVISSKIVLAPVSISNRANLFPSASASSMELTSSSSVCSTCSFPLNDVTQPMMVNTPPFPHPLSLS